MATPTPGWRFTGLHWERAVPLLTACPQRAEPATLAVPEERTPAAPGVRISWTLHAPRTCTGTWTGAGRRPCPAAAPAPVSGTDSQCPSCAQADHGRQIARDAALGDDGREYLLYLAWLGPGLLKTGLTAADRGRDRLLEQGAVTFTILAAGPYVPVRQAERLVSATGLARERISYRAKADAWHRLPPPADRGAQLEAVRDQVARQVIWPARLTMPPCTITDQATDFGLDQATPGDYAEVTAISDHAVLSGQVRLTIGRSLLIDTPAGPVLLDMRKAAGWTIRHARPGTPAAGLSLTTRQAPRESHDVQPSLF